MELSTETVIGGFSALGIAVTVLWRFVVNYNKEMKTTLETNLEECKADHKEAQAAHMETLKETRVLAERVGTLEGKVEVATQVREDIKILSNTVLKAIDRDRKRTDDTV